MWTPTLALRGSRQLIPQLSSARYKGQAGKIGVIGGCAEYTGAPYYAAIAALKCGADLSHVFCTRGAAPVIKTFSPELIVHPYLREQSEDDSGDPSANASTAVQRVEEWLPRLSCLIVGPGLGRDPLVMRVAERIMHKACELNIPMVVDADGLWIWNQDSFDPAPFRATDRTVVLTPNAIEARRLEARYGSSGAGNLSESLGGSIVVVRKGPTDEILEGPSVLPNDSEGCLRRCGGQGDILAGCIATFLSWGATSTPGGEEEEDARSPSAIEAAHWKSLAAYAGSRVTREAARRAFCAHGRAMVSTDLVEEIGPAFSAIFAPEQQEAEP